MSYCTIWVCRGSRGQCFSFSLSGMLHVALRSGHVAHDCVSRDVSQSLSTLRLYHMYIYRINMHMCVHCFAGQVAAPVQALLNSVSQPTAAQPGKCYLIFYCNLKYGCSVRTYVHRIKHAYMRIFRCTRKTKLYNVGLYIMYA